MTVHVCVCIYSVVWLKLHEATKVNEESKSKRDFGAIPPSVLPPACSLLVEEKASTKHYEPIQTLRAEASTDISTETSTEG